jgi:hypothetical protein
MFETEHYRNLFLDLLESGLYSIEPLVISSASRLEEKDQGEHG